MKGRIFINYNKWLEKHTCSLRGKRVAIFGSTGGIGNELCRYILMLDGTLITVDRNRDKASALKLKLKAEFKSAKIYNITADLEDIKAVKNACEELERCNIDILIHNAGACSIPRRTCSTGFNNVFQINFLSPYYITNRLLPQLKSKGARVVIVGSIAHNYSKADIGDIDFSTRKKASLIYGNAKRYLMFSCSLLARDNPEIKLTLTHPGITFTNITAHYPKWIFALIKHPMKIIFMPPKKAALSILGGIFDQTQGFEWIGPSVFDIWGMPSKKALKTCSRTEAEQIYSTAKQIYSEIKRKGKDL